MKRLFEEGNDDDDEIALACSKQFNLLSSRGKPAANEWTHLAAFVIRNEKNQIDILSMGTGTKCLGGEKEERGTQGCLLHDSHAEVIARRALLRFFYEEILQERNLVLIKKGEKKFSWNRSLRLYLFVSYAPCGAAAYLSDPIKRPKLEHKSINSTTSEELYLKPGKGYQTTSLSCTNKINRWIYQGIEGSLLNQMITTPIRLSALVIQTNSDFSSIFKDVQVISVDQSFEYGPSTKQTRPCSMSIGRWKSPDLSPSVITVDGHPLGQVKKLRHQQRYANPLAKCCLFKLYLQLMDHLAPQTTTYAQAKALSANLLRKQFMKNNPQWIQTDSKVFYSFTLSC